MEPGAKKRGNPDGVKSWQIALAIAVFVVVPALLYLSRFIGAVLIVVMCRVGAACPM